jgi:hypothetical protein
MLIHYAMMDYLPFAAYQIKNGGVFKHNSENSETVSKDEIDFLTKKQRDFAEYYTRRFIDYICFKLLINFQSIIITQKRIFIQTKILTLQTGYYNERYI